MNMILKIMNGINDMTELSFLIELLLNHDLPKETKDLIATRIRDVEQDIRKPLDILHGRTANPYVSNGAPKQAASTLAAMARHGDLPVIPAVELPPIPQAPIEQIAQTPAAAAALIARNEAINKAANSKPLNGIPEKGRTSPRKW